MKPISKKYIGGAQACSTYLPFAVNKVKLVDKWRKNKAVASKGYSFSNGVEIKCTATRKLLSVQIRASLGGLIFIGQNQNDPERTFVTDGFTHQSFSRADSLTNLPQYIDTLRDLSGTGDPFTAPMYEWRNDAYTVFCGSGIRYGNPFYDKDAPCEDNRYFGITYTANTVPHISDKNGNTIATGIAGSECVACCIYQGYVVGVDLHGLLKYWPISDSNNLQTQQVTMPSWMGVQVTLGCPTDTSPTVTTGYQGWLDGESGVEWKFNSTGDKLAGIAREIVNYGWGEARTGDPVVLGINDGNTSKHTWRTRPHGLVLYLNPAVSENGNISFSPTVSDSGFNYGLMALDWYYLEDPNDPDLENRGHNPDVLSYSFMDSFKVNDEVRLRLFLITEPINDSFPAKYHDSFNLSIYDNTDDDWPNGTSSFYLKWFGYVTGIDLRYHTYSFMGLGNSDFPRPYEGDELSFAKGFDNNIYKNQIGNTANSDSLFDYDTSGNKYDGGQIVNTITAYFNTVSRSSKYSAGYGMGSSCATIDKGVKKFAYMTITESNTGEFYDTIQVDDVVTTHQEAFESLGYFLTPNEENKLTAVYHMLGVFT